METPFAVTLGVGSSLANKTGAWRVERPVYVDRIPPCNDACPAGEDIQGWLYRAEEGDYEGAWRALVEANPLPAVMGRCCFHPCETACNRATVDEAVGINAVERFLGDLALEHGWALPGPLRPPSGRRVLVVGSGPAGLSAAYHLRRLGHEVVVREASPVPGGMLRYGIPRYRLARDVVAAEIDRILATGVELELGHRVDDLGRVLEAEGFDAAFLGVGAQIGRNAYIPAGDATHVLDAVSLLRSVEGGEAPSLGRRVVVVGGGDTAMDAARTARRLGVAEPLVVYRRTRERMPAHAAEVEEAIEEGVVMRWLATVAGGGEEGALAIEKMALDADGAPHGTGEFEELAADDVVLALGQECDLSLVAGLADVAADRGVVVVGPDHMTGHPGVFAGGDMVAGERTVTAAVGHGKAAARRIDVFLRGEEWAPPARHALAEATRLNTWYYSDAPKTVRPRLDLVRRTSTFDEVVAGLDESTALFEARRCMSCGNCFECDNCFGVCPDNAVRKLGPGLRYEFDYDYCKGCGLCAAECPCGAIDMVPEKI